MLYTFFKKCDADEGIEKPTNRTEFQVVPKYRANIC